MGAQQSTLSAPQAADPQKPFCLPVLPYEIKMMILKDLDQEDLLRGIAQTCRMLREVAYPLAYGNITVDIDPDDPQDWENMDWKGHSGVGYIRHLEIRSLYRANQRPLNVEDLMLEGMLAALPHDGLLSFAFKTPVSYLRSISGPNVESLLAAQRSLKWLELPSTKGAFSEQIRTKLHGRSDNISLKNLVLAAHPSMPFFEQWSEVAAQASAKTSIQLHIHEQGNDMASIFLKLLSKGNPRMQILLSIVAHLTLHEHSFYQIAPQLGHLSFPRVQSLKLLQCKWFDKFLQHATGSAFPALSALMIAGGFSTCEEIFDEFLQQLPEIRELYLEGSFVRRIGASTLSRHARTLALLFLRDPSPRDEWYTDEAQYEALLRVCFALRHVALYFRWARIFYSDDIEFSLSEDNNKLLDCLAAQSALQTLAYRCPVYFKIHDDHPAPKSIDRVPNRFFEEGVGRRVIEHLQGTRGSDHESQSLDYLSVVLSRHCELPGPVQEWETSPPREPKHIFTLKPGPTLKPIVALKENILATYAADGYYLLDSFVDGMLLESHRLPAH